VTACAQPACPESSVPFGNGTLCLRHYRATTEAIRAEAVALDRPPARLAALPGYEQLAEVLDAALAQAQAGKGKERHAADGEAFHDQQIVQLCEWMGSTQGAVFQASKKALESTRLDDDAAERELLGAINYAAAAVLVLRRRRNA
jgi:hypothetical protein